MATPAVVQLPAPSFIGTYILQDGKPMPIRDTVTWAQWMEKNLDEFVRHDNFGNVLVSTVFLGMDEGHSYTGRPILWETMIFSEGDESIDRKFQWRYTSKEDADRNHDYICNLFKSNMPIDEIRQHLEEL